MSAEFVKHFATLKDPRHDKNKLHALPDILFLTVAAVVSGANGWEAIEEFGKAKLDWLRRFFPYDNGVPSHDCIRRVFCALSPKALQRCFANWVQALAELLPGEVVAIDGKTLRHSFDHGANLGAIHMVSAWASVNGVCLGQVKTDAKSNEITAIPQLLQLLELKGCIVTLDAMGCQKEIAREIVEQGGDYVLAVKDNQPQLHEMIVDYFETTDALPTNKVPIPVHEETDGGHGRIEYRRYELIADLSTLPTPEAWKGLKAIGRAIRTCHNGEKTTKETRYYIVSFEEDAPQFARAVRQHWGIENELHWVLDVTFREDDSRIRRGYGAENFAVVRHIALNLLKQHGSKSSLAKKRYRAALDDSFRSEVLM